MIEIEGVTVAFSRTLALESVDAEIAPGVTGLFGPNGSGKSTLLRAIAGLVEPMRGRIVVDGREMNRADPSLRGLLGYAGHSSGLYARLTVAENLKLFARLYGVPPQAVEDALQRLDLGTLSATAAGALSAGQKRRASVARALLHGPQILLLDEPYANVDDEGAETISDAIRSWVTDGRIAVIATHGAKRVRAFAEHGLVLQRGRLARATEYASETSAP
jgi:heme ABC exporter ATP-binding subunit CcmA